ncbi:hypothetical protein KM043_004184 [Ampulex compressa]|nr:hypothetical protein KM043_004184 [Ampulex compressa]
MAEVRVRGEEEDRGQEWSAGRRRANPSENTSLGIILGREHGKGHWAHRRLAPRYPVVTSRLGRTDVITDDSRRRRERSSVQPSSSSPSPLSASFPRRRHLCFLSPVIASSPGKSEFNRRTSSPDLRTVGRLAFYSSAYLAKHRPGERTSEE